MHPTVARAPPVGFANDDDVAAAARRRCATARNPTVRRRIMMTASRFIAAAAAATLSGGIAFAQVSTFDHLACLTVKDKGIAKGSFTLTLTPEQSTRFGVPTGCSIKTPAKELCIATQKTNVSPAPPGAPAGSAAQAYFCYKLKCGKRTANTVTATDQFGSRAVVAKSPNLLCAPAQIASPSGAFIDGESLLF
jgi:hypothetical protein